MKTLLAAVVLVLVFSAASFALFFQWREVARQAFVTYDGEAILRYQWRVVQGPGLACILVLTDEQTGHFAITTVTETVCR